MDNLQENKALFKKSENGWEKILYVYDKFN
jgi:hypothetical protein